MKSKGYKFACITVKWFDKYNGNTYHSNRIIRLRDKQIRRCSYQYGYGDMYRQTALEVMAICKWLPVKYRDSKEQYKYERENDYPILWIVNYGLKKECIENGKEG